MLHFSDIENDIKLNIYAFQMRSCQINFIILHWIIHTYEEWPTYKSDPLFGSMATYVIELIKFQ